MNRWLLSVAMLLCSLLSYAQSPQAMNFQAVARNASGNPLSEKEVGVKVEVLQGSTSGAVVYGETHQATTAKNGVVNLQIGFGAPVQGVFSSIDWSQSPYFLRISMDAKGGTDYKEMATSQMLSVPYAMYAERAGSVESANSEGNFLVVPTDGPSSDLVAGINPHGDDFLFTVIYLDGKDQEVKYEITGLPSDATFTDDGGASPIGRSIDIDMIHSETAGEYQCAFVLKNKYGVTKSYPFVYSCGGYGIGMSDREVLAALKLFFNKFPVIQKEYTDLDKVFMRKDNPYQWENTGGEEYKDMMTLYDKTYDEEFHRSISLYYNSNIDYYNQLINVLSETTEEGISAEVKEQTLKQVKALRAYNYLVMTEWFGAIPFTLDPNNKFGNGDLKIKTRTPRTEVLPHIIADLEAARGLTTQLEQVGELTAEEVEVLYREALLLNGDWAKVAALEASEGIQTFIKKIADWKLQPTGDITEASLMEEYMTTWYDTYMRGNLYLNILDYSATYFNMEPYRALLPLSSWFTMQGVEQNPGYETQEEAQP